MRGGKTIVGVLRVSDRPDANFWPGFLPLFAFTLDLFASLVAFDSITLLLDR